MRILLIMNNNKCFQISIDPIQSSKILKAYFARFANYKGWSSSLSAQYGGYGVGTGLSQNFNSTTGFSKSTDGFRTYSISTGSGISAGYEYNYTYFPFE